VIAPLFIHELLVKNGHLIRAKRGLVQLVRVLGLQNILDKFLPPFLEFSVMFSPPFLVEILSFNSQIPQPHLQLGFISLFSKLDRSEVGSWSGGSNQVVGTTHNIITLNILLGARKSVQVLRTH